MKSLIAVLVLGALVAPFSNAHGEKTSRSFAFNVEGLSGFPSGALSIAGGGTFDPQSGTLKSGGGFRCTQDIQQGPLAGCKSGEGVRWEASEVVPSTEFKCGGADAEPARTAATNRSTIVLKARFYRQGDEGNASFTGMMVVSTTDLDPDRPGTQNVWVEGVGAGKGIAEFH